MPAIDIIDIESSGLSSKSYPIEVGITLSNGDTYSTLIRPCDGWEYWDESAAELHGISKEELIEKGKPIDEVCREINELCKGRVLYSDGWTYDSSWMNTLFGFAGISPSFRISALDPLFGENWSSCLWREMKEQIAISMSTSLHRALTDAMIISQTFLAYQSLFEDRLAGQPANASLAI